MEYFLLAFKNYVNFKGRASRKEYWMFVLFYIIFLIAAAILDNLTGLAFEGIGYGPFYTVFALACLLPSFSIAVRRMHDIGKSGWMLLVSMIPLIGSIWLIVLLVKKGDEGANEYGGGEHGTEVSDFISKA